MLRRVTAVSLACLLAAGLVPPFEAGAAPAAGCARHAPQTAGSRMPALHPDPRSPRPRSPGPRRPGPRSPKPEDVAKVMAELDERLAGVTPPSQITVPTRVHLISRGPDRLVSDQTVLAQIDALNHAYAGTYGGVDTGVRFRLDGISVKQSAAWFADPIGNEKAMKTALHEGGADTLNLYIAQLSELMLGFASYPYWYAGTPASTAS
ncbi:hypothetical protein ACFQYP_39795 [Nonomuraea antimicrobica]